MGKILVMGFCLLFYLNIVGSLVCRYCPMVKPGNICSQKETTCRTGPMHYCYTEIISKEFAIQKVIRSCSSVCRSITFRRDHYEKHRLCCRMDRCNNHNIWVKQN